MKQLAEINSQFQKDLHNIKTASDLDNLHIKYLGRKGKLNEMFQAFGKLHAEDKKNLGKSLNELKNTINRLIVLKKQELLKDDEPKEFIDVTLPGKKYPKGSLHLVTYAIEEITKIFTRIGFIRMSYPEVEWEHYSFEALNMPKGHPARDDFETFFMAETAHPEFGKMVLTPHTSSGQLREMQRLGKPPIRMINIARCYRPNWDVSHTPMFHQFEGMVVDKNINITHLKGTIDYFAKEFFGSDRVTRLRPFHFQFTEPSFEVDISCGVCKGTGFLENQEKCRLCKSGWLELGGSGMIHPNVLKAGNIDSNKYTGWAFGIGIERVVMMKESITLDDLRIMYENDVRFLEQF